MIICTRLYDLHTICKTSLKRTIILQTQIGCCFKGCYFRCRSRKPSQNKYKVSYLICLNGNMQIRCLGNEIWHIHCRNTCFRVLLRCPLYNPLLLLLKVIASMSIFMGDEVITLTFYPSLSHIISYNHNSRLGK